jgi:hypothetical protein
MAVGLAQRQSEAVGAVTGSGADDPVDVATILHATSRSVRRDGLLQPKKIDRL